MRKTQLSAVLLAAALTLTLAPARAAGPAAEGGTLSLSSYQPPLSTPGIPGMNDLPSWQNNSYFKRLSRLMSFTAPYGEQIVVSIPFTDVPSDSWYYPGVCYVWQNNYMSGVSDTSFAPFTPATRAMVWTVLARMGGGDTAPVPGEPWYAPGARWAADWGLTDGSRPQDLVTREQLAAMLWRRAGSPEVLTRLESCTDLDQVSGYAQQAMTWAKIMGLFPPSGSQLLPQQTVCRAELAYALVGLTADRTIFPY